VTNTFSVHESFRTLKENKLRTFFTAFGVAWGIFILVLLMGASSGLEKGVIGLLQGFSRNSLWFYGGRSSAEKGNNTRTKPVAFSRELIDRLEKNYNGIEFISPEVQVPASVFWREEKVNAQVKAVAPDYFHIKTLQTSQGRLFTGRDNARKLKVALIGEQIKKQVFKKDEPVTGQELRIGNSYFVIAGVLKGGTVFSQADQNVVFVPYLSALNCLDMSKEFSVFGVALKKGCKSSKAEQQIKSYLGKQLAFDPRDTNALYVFNFDQQVKSINKLFSGLNMFFWFIGICLLLSGMAGVVNIMFVLVNERTREIGIRKALGAKRKHILMMILTESVTITILAGILGIILGTGTLYILEYVLNTVMGDDFLIKEASVHFGTVAGALFILIMSGLLAGIIPASRAADIEPIEAIREE